MGRPPSLRRHFLDIRGVCLPWPHYRCGFGSSLAGGRLERRAFMVSEMQDGYER